jgi:small-conductance mechanosensitive channel
MNAIAQVWRWATTPILSLGGSTFSAAGLAALALAIFAVVVAGRLLRRALVARLLPQFNVQHGLAYAVSNIVFYGFVSLGTIVTVQSFGVNLTSLTVLLGALGVGVGFGLQEVAANFVSGLVILLERPIEVGDRVQVGELDGQVTRINIRATELLTNDAVAVIVPNKNFITMQVVNWSRGGDAIRVHAPIGVAYGTNPQLVRSALMEAAASVPSVLREPAPDVRLVEFGDSSVNFELLAWTRESLQKRMELVSELNFAIDEVLKRRHIEIPFPQRDVHVREPVRVTITEETPALEGR